MIVFMAVEMKRAVAGLPMPLFGRGGTEIAEGKNPHRAGPPAGVAQPLDILDHLAEAAPLAGADFAQGVPQLRFEPHAGAPAFRSDIAIDQTAFRHGVLLAPCIEP